MLLIAALHGGEGPGLVPARGDQVLEPRGVPVHRGQRSARRTGQVSDPEAHRGVRRARGRVAERGGRLARFRRVRPVPLLDRRLVHARHQHVPAVRAPPVAAVAAHRLRRHVLRAAETHRRTIRRGDHPVGLPVGADHAHRTAADVADTAAAGIRPGIHGRLPGRHPAHRPVRRPGHPQLPGQGEGQQPAGPVRREPDDAGGHHPGALPAGPLLGGQLLGRPAQQADRVGEQPLRPGHPVHRPQAADRVIPGPAAQEEDGPAVRRHAWPGPDGPG